MSKYSYKAHNGFQARVRGESFEVFLSHELSLWRMDSNKGQVYLATSLEAANWLRKYVVRTDRRDRTIQNIELQNLVKGPERKRAIAQSKFIPNKEDRQSAIESIRARHRG